MSCLLTKCISRLVQCLGDTLYDFLYTSPEEQCLGPAFVRQPVAIQHFGAFMLKEHNPPISFNQQAETQRTSSKDHLRPFELVPLNN